MRTNFAINETLLERDLLISGLTTEKETVNLALKEFIERRKREEVISLLNTVEYDIDYDYKILRNKR